jgi:predicted DNA-binding transcriptional regulator YafY
MYHPTSRVLSVLEMLQSQRSLSGTALAERLQVDPRTVRRYILMLQDMGIPIEADMGRHGGYYLRPGFKLPPLMFSDDEGVAVILGLMLAQQIGLVAAAPAIDGAIAKLERVLPASLRDRVQAIQQTLTLQPARNNVPVVSAVLSTLSLAAYQQQQVMLGYQKDDTTSERVFDPYGIVSHEGRWYTVGYCHLRQALRVFRLDRVSRLKLLDTSFVRPADFDCLDYLLQSITAIRDRWDIEVIVKTTLDEARSKVPSGLATFEELPGGVRLRSSFDDLESFARLLIGWGWPFSVCQPSELRTVLHDLAGEIIRCASD